MQISAHATGVLAGFLAALSVACDGVTVKLASRDGAQLSTIMLFKSGLGLAFLSLMVAGYALVAPCVTGSAHRLSGLRRPSPVALAHILFGGAMSGIMSCGFTLAFYYATSANVLALTALAPIWTALLSKPVLGLPLPWRTIWANVGALAGTIIVVVGVAFEASGEQPRSARDSGLGTLFALMTSLSASAYVMAIRSAHQRAPGTEMAFASLLGMLLATLISLALVPLLQPTEPLVPVNRRALLWLSVSGFFVVALAMVLINAAARLASPAEVSLILQLEGLLGPISVYVFLNEVPSVWSLGGGSLVLLMVVCHEALALYAGRAARREEAEAEGGGREGRAQVKAIA